MELSAKNDFPKKSCIAQPELLKAIDETWADSNYQVAWMYEVANEVFWPTA